jgi:hypothetical protein
VLIWVQSDDWARVTLRARNDEDRDAVCHCRAGEFGRHPDLSLEDFRGDLATISIPVLVIHGDQDRGLRGGEEGDHARDLAGLGGPGQQGRGAEGRDTVNPRLGRGSVTNQEAPEANATAEWKTTSPATMNPRITSNSGRLTAEGRTTTARRQLDHD